MINDEDLTKYQEIYRQKFGKEISREDALVQALKLIQLMRIVYQAKNNEITNKTLEAK